MSKSHIKSSLLLQNQPTGYDKNTIFCLAPLNEDCITNEGYIPTNKIATFRQYEGKNVNGVAIEESTTNLLPSIQGLTFNNYSSRCKLTFYDNIAEIRTLTESIDIAFSLSSNYISITPNVYYTLSFYVKSADFTNIDSRSQTGFPTYRTAIAWFDSSNNWISNSYLSDTVIKPNWKRFVISDIAPTNASKARIAVGIDSPQPNYKNAKIYIKDISFEQKPFATSYVQTSRSSGILKYDLPSSFNSSQGTISFWYYREYPNSYITDQITSPKLIQIGEYYTNSSITIWNLTNSLNFYAKGSSGSGWSVMYESGILPTLNNWTHIALTWNNTTWKFYINGNLITTNTATQTLGSINGNCIYIGGDGNGTNFRGKVANGILSDIRIDKIALSDDEVLQIYLAKSNLSNINNYGKVW
ncbi:MAG: LamG domain-containing protein [bacterium]|nr:LamG domain-containing protein [bacterium]